MDSLSLAKKLRAYESEHPIQAIAGGFIPVVGEASAAAALRDPDAPWWEKALNVPGLIPGLAGLSKGAVAGVKGAKPAAEAIAILASKLAKIHPEEFKRAAKFIDPTTGKEMAEIDDSLASIDHELLDQKSINQIPMSLEDSISHPSLFKAEPYLKDVNLDMGGFDDPTWSGAYFSKRGNTPGHMRIKDARDPTNARSMKNFENTMFHETQHAADDASGLLTGGGLEGPSYWFDPSEIRARVAAARKDFSPSGRVKYPFDQHMNDEISRLRSMQNIGAPLGEARLPDLNRQVGSKNLSLEDLLRK